MEHSFSQKEQPPNLEVKGRETATAGGLSDHRTVPPPASVAAGRARRSVPRAAAVT